MRLDETRLNNRNIGFYGMTAMLYTCEKVNESDWDKMSSEVRLSARSKSSERPMQQSAPRPKQTSVLDLI